MHHVREFFFPLQKPQGDPKLFSVFELCPGRFSVLPLLTTVSRCYVGQEEQQTDPQHSMGSLELKNYLVRKCIYSLLFPVWNLGFTFIWK